MRSGGAVRHVETALADLNEKVRTATQVFGELKRFSLRQAAWQQLIVAVMAIVVTLAAVWWYVPWVGELDPLRAARDRPQVVITELTARNPEAWINNLVAYAAVALFRRITSNK